MRFGLRQLAFTVTPPLLTLGLLAGIVAEKRTHLKPQDVEPYHARAKAAVEQVPYTIGTWSSRDEEIPTAAQKLLQPNAILYRTYVDGATDVDGGRTAAAREERSASLLIVQCQRTGDMVGHYPPICYRAYGMTQDEKHCRPRDWSVNGTAIPGYEYQFTEVLFQGQTRRTTVYNFFIVPGRGIVRDMKDVERAAEDYQQRHYGAAQFQVVFHGPGSSDEARAERDEVFATLMGPNIRLIETLISGGLK